MHSFYLSPQICNRVFMTKPRIERERERESEGIAERRKSKKRMEGGREGGND